MGYNIETDILIQFADGQRIVITGNILAGEELVKAVAQESAHIFTVDMRIHGNSISIFILQDDE